MKKIHSPKIFSKPSLISFQNKTLLHKFQSQTHFFIFYNNYNLFVGQDVSIAITSPTFKIGMNENIKYSIHAILNYNCALFYRLCRYNESIYGFCFNSECMCNDIAEARERYYKNRTKKLRLPWKILIL